MVQREISRSVVGAVAYIRRPHRAIINNRSASIWRSCLARQTCGAKLRTHTQKKAKTTWHSIDGDSFVELFLAQNVSVSRCQDGAHVTDGHKSAYKFTRRDHLPIVPYLVDYICRYYYFSFKPFSSWNDWLLLVMGYNSHSPAIWMMPESWLNENVSLQECLPVRMIVPGLENVFLWLLAQLLLVFLNRLLGNKKKTEYHERRRPVSPFHRTNDYTAGIIIREIPTFLSIQGGKKLTFKKRKKPKASQLVR
jgi:hypothetical protein